MYTIITILLFLGFFFLYTTSKRNRGDMLLFLNNPEKNSVVLKAAGYSILVVAFILLRIFEGLGTGFFLGFVLLMIIASLVILIKPLELFGYKGVLLIFACLLILELIL